LAENSNFYGNAGQAWGNLAQDGIVLQTVPLPPLADPLPQTSVNPCFAAGTHILTEAGEVLVEDIRAGDVVILAEDDPAPVIWVGARDLVFDKHPMPEAVRPVRIKAGALAMGVPERDLVVSPDHGIYFDGSLVQAKDLIDGVVIAQDWAVASVKYYHLEFKTHTILLAEGAAVESYLDTGHRGVFKNAAAPLLLHPDLMQIRRQSRSVAPLVTGGEALAAIRAQLHARKLMLGFAVNEITRTGLLVGGELLAPFEEEAGRVSFRIPEGVREAVLASPVFVPAEVDPASNDRRRLGLAMTEILIDGKMIPIEQVANIVDLHKRAPRESATWTRGAVRLRFPAGAQVISLMLAASPRIWQRRRAG
jgi:hypothetical protein